MAADPTTVSLPRAEIQLTMENRGTRSLESTADSVLLFAWRDGRWSNIVQKADELALEPVTISPDDSYEWTISVNTAALGPLYLPGQHDGEQRFVLRLPPGTYALGYPVSRAGEDERRTYARSFSVRGDRAALEPSAVHEKTFRDDGTLVVRTGTEREYEHSRKVSVRIERGTSWPMTAAKLSWFELYNPGYELVRDLDSRVFVSGRLTTLLRDAFAAAKPNDDRIRVETVDTTSPALGMQGAKAIRWNGHQWRLSAQEGWDSKN